MSQLVTREMLEEIMLSFTIDIYSEEDIEFINNVYRDYMNKKYIFQLSKTEQYFKQFVITYCRVNYQTIVDKINFTNQQNKDDFIRNFGEEPKTHNNNVFLEIPGDENEPLLENNEHQNIQMEENRNQNMIYYIIRGIGGVVVVAGVIGLIGFGIYLCKKK